MNRAIALLRRLLALPLVAALLGPSACTTGGKQARPRLEGGAVASASSDATAVGLATLQVGGNAVDAAVATALALAVVHPEAGNLGGGGFAVGRASGELFALDFRETAPAAATPTMFLDADGRPVPERSLVGPLAAGVPGSPRGLWELHRRFGRLPWREVVRPAVRLAREGFLLSTREAGAIAAEVELLRRFPETAAVWLPGGAPPRGGTRVRLPRLAALLEDYGERGPDAVVTGEAARAIEGASRRWGGVLTAADLAAYRPVWREPVRFSTFGWEVASMPLPSSGGIILGETCLMLERLGWATLPRGGAEGVHLLVEVWRRAYADRVLLGDPATTAATEQDLLDPRWLVRRAAEIPRDRATPSAELRSWSPGAAAERLETTHLSVVDSDGNAVALTTTLNGSFGCGLLVPELELLLNNEMDDFAAAPGTPNLYGLVQGEANAVGPGKRMLSSMTPTVAWRGGEIVALGSPGGSRIPTATAQVLLALLLDGSSLQVAVDRPRLHHQWLPDEVLFEAGAIDPAAAQQLAALGHHLVARGKLGEVHAARRLVDGRLEAAADRRGPGSAAVWLPSARAARP
ncbi:MAG: gamma-glutamyltransferase [Thermoanaerobaculaceae bacterium]|nr:gamma-glutamyltransferase [Thermoanaerobaculaceae bacterium]